MKNFKLWASVTIVGVLFIFGFLFWGATKYQTPSNAASFGKLTCESSGTVRIISGWYYEPETIEDEQGNLWGWDEPLNEDSFYILWIADNGTSEIKDDIIIKICQEI